MFVNAFEKRLETWYMRLQTSIQRR